MVKTLVPQVIFGSSVGAFEGTFFIWGRSVGFSSTYAVLGITSARCGQPTLCAARLLQSLAAPTAMVMQLPAHIRAHLEDHHTRVDADDFWAFPLNAQMPMAKKLEKGMSKKTNQVDIQKMMKPFRGWRGAQRRKANAKNNINNAGDKDAGKGAGKSDSAPRGKGGG